MYKYPYGDSQQLNLDWILAKLKELEAGVLGLDLEKVSNALISLTYNTNTAYRRYDYAFLNGKLYRCLTDTTGAFDPAAWQEALIGDDLAVLTRWINAIDAAAVVDVKFDTSGTNGKIQQKYHDQYHDVVEVDYTPVQDSKRPLSSNAGYELNSAINGRINRGAVDISVLTDIWLVTAKDGVYMVTGSSRIGTFVEDADHNFGILTLATAPQTSFDYGYIAFHSTTGRTFYRDFTRANDNISWRTALQKIAIGSEISNLSDAITSLGNANQYIIKQAGTYTTNGLVLAGYTTGSGNYFDFYIPISISSERTISSCSLKLTTVKLFLPDRVVDNAINTSTLNVMSRNDFGFMCEATLAATQTANRAASLLCAGITLVIT